MTATQFLDLPSGRIAYDDDGEGPLIVCTPAMLDLRSELRFLTPLLVRAGFRVVTLDQRGMGESSVAWPEYGSTPLAHDLMALIRHLDAGPALIYGTSNGAAAGVYVAAEAPELVRGLILVAPFVRNGKLNVAEHKAALTANLKEPGRGQVVAAYMQQSHAEAEARLGRVKVPVIVIMGTADVDWADPLAEAQWVCARLSAELTVLDGAGHHPHVEFPEKIAETVTAFQQKLSA